MSREYRLASNAEEEQKDPHLIDVDAFSPV
jgi:hypothetical protein